MTALDLQELSEEDPTILEEILKRITNQQQRDRAKEKFEQLLGEARGNGKPTLFEQHAALFLAIENEDSAKAKDLLA